jgi:hypothetical protein
MKYVLPLLASLLAACSVLGPVMEAQQETLARVAAMEAQVEDARRAAVEVQRQYEAGALTETERDAALDRLRAETLDALAAVRDALAATGDAVRDIDLGAVVEGAARDAAPLLPPPYDSLAAALAALAGAWGLSRREARRAADDVDARREARRAVRHEPHGLAVPPPAADEDPLAGLAVGARRTATYASYRHPIADPVDETHAVRRKKWST